MANTIKGLTVEIGGDTTKLGKALEDVNKKSKDLSSELGQINKMLKLDPGNTELLAQKQKVLAEAISNTGKKLDTLKAAEAQVQEQFKKGDVSEAQVRELQREIMATEKKMNSYAKAAEDVEKSLRGAGDSADKTGDNVKGMGDDADKAEKDVDELEKSTDKLDGTLGKVAKAGLATCAAGLAALSAAAVAAGKALIDCSVGGAQYADTVLTESTVTGIATDKLQEYMYAAELVDVSTDTLTKSMGKNIKSMKAVQDGTKLSVEAYDKLGVSALNADGSLRDGETVYWEVIDALGKMENETERDALAMQVLGKSAQELNPLIEAGSAKMGELGEQAREAGYVMSEETLEAFGKFDDQMQYLKVGAEGAKNALGTVLLPMLTDLAGEGVDFLGEFTRGVQQANGDVGAIADLISTLLPNVVSKILSYVPQVLTLVTSVVSALGSALVESAPMLVSSLMDIATTLLNTLTAGIPQLLTVGTQIILNIMEGLTQALPQITQTITGMIPSLVNALVMGIPQLIQGAVQLLTAIVQAIPMIVPPLVEALPSIAMAIVNGLITAIPTLITGAVQFLTAIVQAIPTMLESLTVQIPTIVNTIIQGLIGLIPTLLDGAVQMLTAVVDAIPLIIEQLVPVIPNIVNTVITGLIQMLPMLLDGAVTLLMAIVNAIPVIIESLIPAIPTIVNTVITGLLQMLPTLLNGAVTLLMAIIEAIPLILPPLITALPEIIMTITSVLMQNIPLLIQTAIQLFLAIVKAIPQVLGSIITGVGKIGSAILDYFKELPSKMPTIGKNLVEGLWNGIKDMAGWVKKKISGFTSDVLDGIKNFFGIKSPSRVMRDQVGKNLALGLAEGVEKNADKASEATEKMAQDLLNAAKKRLDNHKVYNDLTLADEVDYWDEVRKQVTEGTQARIEADKKYFETVDKLEKEQEKEKEKKAEDDRKRAEEERKRVEDEQKAYIEANQKILSDAEKHLSDMKVYRDVSLAEEVAYWDKVRKQCADGTDARIAADKNYLTAKKSMTDEVKKLNATYEADVKNVQANLIKDIQAVTKAYDDAVASRKSQITASMGLFSDVNLSAGLTDEDITNKLRNQVDVLRIWDETLDKLSNREGMDANLLAELQGMGPDSLLTMKSIANMSDDQFAEYIGLYQQKSQIAMERAQDENAQLLADTQDQIQTLTKNAETDLQTIESVYVAGLESLGVEVSESSRGIGVNIVDGLKQGIVSEQNSLQNFLKKFFNSLVLNAKATLDINSPSRVFADEVGKQIPAGVAQGIRDNSKTADITLTRLFGGLTDQANRIDGLGLQRTLQSPFGVGTSFGAAGLDISALLIKLDNIYQRLGNLQVVLDSGALVGGTIDKIDAGLAMRQTLHARGV